MAAWYPPPPALPDQVRSVREFLDGEGGGLLTAACRLGGGALAVSCGGDETLARLVEGGERMVAAGRLSAAAGLLEPVAFAHPHAAALCGIALYRLGRRCDAVLCWEGLGRVVDRATPSCYTALSNLATLLIREDRSLHPEADAMTVCCAGRGIDVGCGGFKTVPEALGVDLTPAGSRGSAGGQEGVASAADLVSSGDDLACIADGSLDYVVARHNLEHYRDPLAALEEWLRVLRPGGLMALALPDHEHVDTIALDATHFHVFTGQSIARLLDRMPGVTALVVGPLMPRWSLIVVAQKQGGDPFDYETVIRHRERERVALRQAAYAAAGDDAMAAQCAAEIARLAAGGGG